jgi:RNA polymerase sigma factor (sigma-70 family)
LGRVGRLRVPSSNWWIKTARIEDNVIETIAARLKSMPTSPLSAVIQHLTADVAPGADGMTDAELLAQFLSSRDDNALAALVRRHAPMVWGVCGRLLHNHHDAEDVFQATFLVLVRKAADVPSEAVANWLYGVARQIAVRLRATAAKRGRRETQVADMPEPAVEEVRDTDWLSVLDEVLSHLPDRYRGVIVLCDLEGMTRKEAARQLAIPEGSVASRLARARAMLAKRLIRRGLFSGASVAAVLSAASASGAAPPALVVSTIKAVTLVATGRAAAAISVKVAALTEGMVKAMSPTKMKSVLAVVLVVGLVLGGIGVGVGLDLSPEAVAQPPGVKTDDKKPDLGPVAWKEVKELGLQGWIPCSVAYSADGKTLYVGGTKVCAYEIAPWKKLWEYSTQTNCGAVAVSPDDKSVAVTFTDADRWGVRLISAATGKLETTIDEGGKLAAVGVPISVGFFPDVLLPAGDGQPQRTSHKLIIGTANGYWVKTWVDPEKVSTITSRTVADGGKVTDLFAAPLAVAPDGKRVVVNGPIDKDTGLNVLWAWSAGSGEANKLLEGHKGTVICAAWAKNGKVIVTGDDSGVVIVWDAVTFKEKSRVKLGGRVVSVAVTDDGVGIAAGAYRSSPATGNTADVFVWAAGFPPEKPEPLSSRTTHPPLMGCAGLSFSPDGKQLVACFAIYPDPTHYGFFILVGRVQVFAVVPVAPVAPPPVPVPPVTTAPSRRP